MNGSEFHLSKSGWVLKGTSLWHQKAATSVNSALRASPWVSLEDRKMNRTGYTKFSPVGTYVWTISWCTCDLRGAVGRVQLCKQRYLLLLAMVCSILLGLWPWVISANSILRSCTLEGPLKECQACVFRWDKEWLTPWNKRTQRWGGSVLLWVPSQPLEVDELSWHNL